MSNPFCDLMIRRVFLLNSPALMNAQRSRKSLLFLHEENRLLVFQSILWPVRRFTVRLHSLDQRR